jgi:hypothetical protein
MPRKPKIKPYVATGEARTETLEEFLARGGTVTVCPPGARSEDITYKHKYGRSAGAAKKKKKKDE